MATFENKRKQAEVVALEDLPADAMIFSMDGLEGMGDGTIIWPMSTKTNPDNVKWVRTKDLPESVIDITLAEKRSLHKLAGQVTRALGRMKER